MPNPGHPYFKVLTSCQQHNATLVVVSKTRTPEQIMPIYHWGQRVFGENRVQELAEKYVHLPKDIEWHLIGYLQTNKVRAVLPLVSCIHSLDRISLWEKLDAECRRADLTIKCLLEIKIASETTKHGWDINELRSFLSSGKHLAYQQVLISGVMGMASLTDNATQIHAEMQSLRQHFDLLKEKYFNNSPTFNTISMGMSGDYEIALAEGSTMVRVGSLLFE